MEKEIIQENHNMLLKILLLLLLWENFRYPQFNLGIVVPNMICKSLTEILDQSFMESVPTDVLIKKVKFGEPVFIHKNHPFVELLFILVLLQMLEESSLLPNNLHLQITMLCFKELFNPMNLKMELDHSLFLLLIILENL